MSLILWDRSLRVSTTTLRDILENPSPVGSSPPQANDLIPGSQGSVMWGRNLRDRAEGRTRLQAASEGGRVLDGYADLRTDVCVDWFQ